MSPTPSITTRLELPADSALWQRDFVFGAGTSAYQIEGATEVDGRLASIWDRFCASPGKIARGESGARACEHYTRWAEDLDLLQQLGVDAYRFSIAWPRVMDEAGRPNPRGIAFYRRLLDGLQERGIQAYLTLYHWDLPQYLEDRGGWLNRDTAYRFADYADLMSRALSGGVAAWATHNEPWCAAYLGYANGHHAPGHDHRRWGPQAMHHLLLGHGLALPALRSNAPQARHGLVANVAPGYPLSQSAADLDAAALFDAFQNDWVLDPLLRGDYPQALWRLWPGCEPLVLTGDMAAIAQPLDYLGLNYYSRAVLRSPGPDRFDWVHLPEVERTTMDWEVHPQGLEDMLLALRQRYGSSLPPLYITENGMSSDDRVDGEGQIADLQRLAYLQRHLQACSRAMAQGVDLRGYFVWSLLDNFEWAYGYERRFGLVHVDFETQQRRLKQSALAYADLLRRRRSV